MTDINSYAEEVYHHAKSNNVDYGYLPSIFDCGSYRLPVWSTCYNANASADSSTDAYPHSLSYYNTNINTYPCLNHDPLRKHRARLFH